jgi:hypothetical protein
MTAWLCLTLAALLAGPEVRVQTLDGRTVTGVVTAWDNDHLALQSAEGPLTVATNELASVAPTARVLATISPSDATLELTDGSQWTTRDVTSSASEVSFADTTGAKFQLPLQTIASIRLGDPSLALLEQWKTLRQTTAASDLLIIRKENSLDYLEGVIGQIGADKIGFTLDGDALDVPRARVYGMVFYHPAQEQLPAPHAVATLRDGSRLALARLDWQADRLGFQTAFKSEVVRPWADLVRIDYASGRLAYLSDLEPETEEWIATRPLPQPSTPLERFFRPRRDASLDGGPLRLAGKTYQKGLAARPRTRFVYRLNGDYRRLLATVGIDDLAGDSGQVKLTILGDGKELLVQTIAGDQPPLPLDLAVEGVKRLELVVDSVAPADSNCHLDLCDVRVLR